MTNTLEWNAPKPVHKNNGKIVEVLEAHCGNSYHRTFDICIIKQLCPCCDEIASWFVQASNAVLSGTPENRNKAQNEIADAVHQLQVGLQSVVDADGIDLS